MQAAKQRSLGGAEIDGVSGEEIVDMFNEAQPADYRELATACQDTLAGNKKKKLPDFATELEGKLK